MTASLRTAVAAMILVFVCKATPAPLPTDDGYRGIWYSNQKTGDQYRFKYSGGMATYPQQLIPMAVYSEEAKKTFFVYGGVTAGGEDLLHLVSYFDHRLGTVPRPRILLNKRTTDAHDNPTLQIDPLGHLWVFSASHGTSRPSYIHKSVRPLDISEFEMIKETNFSYSQPWCLPCGGFLLLHTKYTMGRELRWMFSPDGQTWTEPAPLAHIAQGSYQVSWVFANRVGAAFDYHPSPGGLNARTNLYYLETADQGRDWTTVNGTQVTVPILESKNPALVRDYQSEGLLVYLKDLNFDTEGRPVILYLTSKGYAPGPDNGPRRWMTAHWIGDTWEFHAVAESDHNYDHGSLYVESDGTWRIIAPTEAGPQAFGAGGQMVLWTSRDEGRSWTREKQLTHDSQRNHTYARRPLHAHPDFYAFWADGDAFRPSGSNLYFTDSGGRHVYRLPAEMSSDFAAPDLAW